MDTILYSGPPRRELSEWYAFLNSAELFPAEDADFTVIIRDNGKIIAAGSRAGNILKYIAVAPEYRGMDITAGLITELRKNAFEEGISHLFLYTKPNNRLLFESILFYPVAETGSVLLMEDRRNGISGFLNSLSFSPQGKTGAVVMNCNPFTLGHRYLIEKALESCDRLCVFVVSEDKSIIPAQDRLKLVTAGTEDLNRVSVFPTGSYLISASTFPDYFLKRETDSTRAQCELDIKVFTQWFAPRFNISRRFAGSEPYSAVTAAYNRCMSELLPEYGIEFIEIDRFASEQEPVSASRVRELFGRGEEEKLKKLVPKSTLDYLKKNSLI